MFFVETEKKNMFSGVFTGLFEVPVVQKSAPAFLHVNLPFNYQPVGKSLKLQEPPKNNDPVAAKWFYVERFTSQQIFTVVFHLFVETERKRQQKEIPPLQKKGRPSPCELKCLGHTPLFYSDRN